MKLNSAWIPWILLLGTIVAGISAISGRMMRVETKCDMCCENCKNIERKLDRMSDLIREFVLSNRRKTQE
jgi:hypothetical protein